MTKLEIINNILVIFICIMWVANVIQEVYIKVELYKLFKLLEKYKNGKAK